MFVDSLVLLINACLPLFLLQVYFIQINKEVGVSLSLLGLSLCLSLAVSISYYLSLSSAFGGYSSETIRIIGLFVGWVTFLYASIKTLTPIYKALLLCLICISWCTYALLELLLYWQGQWYSETLTLATIFGGFIGILIAWSIHILLNLVLWNIARFWTLGLAACFCAGMVSHTIDLLAQINLIPELGNTYLIENFLHDNAILGSILNIFLGYKSTVSTAYIIVYLTVFVISCVVFTKTFIFRTQQSTANRSQQV